MNCHSPTPDSIRLRTRVAALSLLAFSLIEVLVVMALLSIIVIGLLAMFNQTQRAFRVGLTQTDVLESGRVTGDFLRRELEQITPSQQSGAVNFDVWLPNYIPLEQGLPGSTVTRINLNEDLFFLTKVNQRWVGIGYFVRTYNPNTGAVEPSSAALPPTTATAGTLYRFEASIPTVTTVTTPPQIPRGPDYLFTLYTNIARTTFWSPNNMPVTRIADGVVHFKVRAFNTNGNRIVPLPTYLPPYTNNISQSGVQTNATITWWPNAPGEVQYTFYSNAVPAAVEVEYGILEDKVWQRFKNLPTPNAQYSYLTGVVGRVHVFRQRVQVRNVDPIAYQ